MELSITTIKLITVTLATQTNVGIISVSSRASSTAQDCWRRRPMLSWIIVQWFHGRARVEEIYQRCCSVEVADRHKEKYI